jgi:hypothetical protein
MRLPWVTAEWSALTPSPSALRPLSNDAGNLVAFRWRPSDTELTGRCSQHVPNVGPSLSDGTAQGSGSHDDRWWRGPARRRYERAIQDRHDRHYVVPRRQAVKMPPKNPAVAEAVSRVAGTAV